jgi:ABC-type phosphate transport system substrate-binding protein
MNRNLLAAAFALCSSAAFAAVPCSGLTNPVYITGSSAVKPILAAVSAPLAAGTPSVTIVYKSQGSCAGVDAIANGTVVAGTASYWAGGVESTCDLPVTGIAADVGASDVFADTCGITLGASNGEFSGPIQVMNLVVPVGSSESAISEEAAAVIFKYGGVTKTVSPWTDKNFFFIRADTSGTKLMIAKAIGLPAASWLGTVKSGSGDVRTAVAGSTSPSTTIGILASDLADSSRDTIKPLAYQAKGQLCGYRPDSASGSFDKANVRDGHYPIWGPVHLTAAVTAGVPTSANVKAVIDFLGFKATAEADVKTVIDAISAAHAVPDCAMHVTRSTEMGALSSYQPDRPCGCYFESKVGGASAACHVCTTNTDCASTVGAPTCRYGFCEAK